MSSSPNEESAIGKFFRQLQEKLQVLFGDIDRDFQGIEPGKIKKIMTNGQLGVVLLYTIVTLMLFIFAIFYRIDKAKLMDIELPYNLETISYQALDFTHPSYKGKYQYFPMMLFVAIMLSLILTIFILIMIKLTDFKVKGFYFMTAILFLIPILIFIILYAKISRYLKPRNEAKNKINALFYKYMIDVLNAKKELSVIPDGGRYSTIPIKNALTKLANEVSIESDDVKKMKLTKAIVTFTLYKYYLEKSMDRYIVQEALLLFSKYNMKGTDYCKYLPYNLRSLSIVDITNIVLNDRDISSVFTASIINKAKSNANIILRQINQSLNDFDVDEDVVKKFIMTNMIIWTIFLMIIGVVLMPAINYRKSV